MAANDCAITLAGSSTTVNLTILTKSQKDKQAAVSTVTTIAAGAGTTINLAATSVLIIERTDIPGDGIKVECATRENVPGTW